MKEDLYKIRLKNIVDYEGKLNNHEDYLKILNILEKKSDFLNEEAQRKKLFKVAASRNILSLEEYNNLIKYANEFIIERKNTFHSFLIQNEELTHEIKKKMLSLR